MGKHVVLYDTTLRDGAQRSGISFAVSEKLRLLRRLDELGFAYIEGGWPGSNPKDAEFFRALEGERLRNARLASFSSTRRPGIRAADDVNLQALLRAATPVTCLVGKASPDHVELALGTTREENLAMVRDSVAFLKARGKEVVFDAEHFFDGFRLDRAYALAVLEAAEEGGADWLVLCDTNGGTLPRELSRIVSAVRGSVASPLGIHCHDDSGVAVANSLAAVEEGCTMVQGTINGYGERCGNANLITIAADLQLKMGISCLPDSSLPQLASLSRFTADLANLHPREEAPYVGRNAFAHKAGIHVSALRKDPSLYEHVQPESVGSERRIIVSELSGRSNLQQLFEGWDLTDAELRDLVERVKELEYEGYEFEGAEASLELLVHASRTGRPRLFELECLKVTVERRADGESYAEARIRVRTGERTAEATARGNGPVNALDGALRKVLRVSFPGIDRMELLDYKVRVLEGDAGTGARVRVRVESGDGERTWGTVGVSTDIIEASWQALADSVEYFLNDVRAPAARKTS